MTDFEKQQLKAIESIKKNVQFFFWLTVAAIFIAAIYYMVIFSL